MCELRIHFFLKLDTLNCSFFEYKIKKTLSKVMKVNHYLWIDRYRWFFTFHWSQLSNLWDELRNIQLLYFEWTYIRAITGLYVLEAHSKKTKIVFLYLIWSGYGQKLHKIVLISLQIRDTELLPICVWFTLSTWFLNWMFSIDLLFSFHNSIFAVQ